MSPPYLDMVNFECSVHFFRGSCPAWVVEWLEGAMSNTSQKTHEKLTWTFFWHITWYVMSLQVVGGQMYPLLICFLTFCIWTWCFFNPCSLKWINNLNVLVFVHLIPSWLVCAEIKCMVHITLPKKPIIQFKPVQQSRRQDLRAYCPNVYVLQHYLGGWVRQSYIPFIWKVLQ